MIDRIQILAMLPRVIETRAGDLWKLACPVETTRCKWIRRRCIHVPTDVRRSAIWIRDSIVEESFVIAVPWISLMRESVGCIWSPFMVTMDLRER